MQHLQGDITQLFPHFLKIEIDKICVDCERGDGDECCQGVSPDGYVSPLTSYPIFV